MFFLQNCKSNKGGSIVLFEKSQLYLKNISFINSSSNAGAVLFLYENYQYNIVMISSCQFYNNSGSLSVIDSSDTEIIIKDTIFANNINILFLLDFSNLTLFNVTALDQKCSNSYPGCFIKSSLNSNIYINFLEILRFTNFNENEESAIYSEDSSIFIENSLFKNITGSNERGSCLSLHNSYFALRMTVFMTFKYNCIYADFNSSLTINQTYFNNKGFISSYFSEFGVLACIGCNYMILKYSMIENINNADYGSAVYLVSDGNNKNHGSAIINNSFLTSFSFIDGGSVYLYNHNSTIYGNLFFYNFAFNGGAIYCNNEGK